MMQVMLLLPFTVNLPASDVVQEGELGVHQAGQQGDLRGGQEEVC